MCIALLTFYIYFAQTHTQITYACFYNPTLVLEDAIDTDVTGCLCRGTGDSGTGTRGRLFTT